MGIVDINIATSIKDIIMAISESFFGDCILDLLSIPDRSVDIIFFSIFKR
jgi:hypothetical protein